MTPLKITAGMVAAELRRLADALDKEPETEVASPSMYFSCMYGTDPKQHFLNVAKLMLRPFKKQYTDSEIRLVYDSPALDITTYTSREKVCTLIEPAKPAVYKCEESWLSPDVEAQLDVGQAAIVEEEERECVANNGQFGVGA